MQQIELGEIKVEVILKNIKNIHLAVHPPLGRVRIAAPERMSLDTIRVFALTKISWIKKQQQKFQLQDREAPREFINRESHYLFGERYLLQVIEKAAAPRIEAKHTTLVLSIRPGTSPVKKKAIIDDWYRSQLKQLAGPLIAKWENRMDVRVDSFGIKKMKTKWGTCKPEARRIWLNLELAKKPVNCIEYIIVHELVHLFEKNHNERFVGMLTKYLPDWKGIKEELNRLPVAHEEWDY